MPVKLGYLFDPEDDQWTPKSENTIKQLPNSNYEQRCEPC